MFSRRKRNYAVFVYTALIILICILIVAILWPQSPDDSQANVSRTDAANTQNKDNEADKSNNFVDDDLDDNDWQEILDDEMANSEVESGKKVESDETDNNDASTNAELQSYYIVRKEGDYISVFFVNEDGQKMKLEDTSIVYDVLTLEDQARFDKGIVVEKQEQLASLLQDFES